MSLIFTSSYENQTDDLFQNEDQHDRIMYYNIIDFCTDLRPHVLSWHIIYFEIIIVGIHGITTPIPKY